jgi:MoxR-like ATPase
MTAMATLPPPVDRAADLERLGHVQARLGGVLKGKKEVVHNLLVCLLARGHILLEDRPGLGKTTLAKALAVALGGRFARVQCTPDLLPSDITGFNIFNQKTREFEFRRGPVFSDILLADEINRATPRTQSALLEAMAERQVTVDAERHVLPAEFFVIATQNPHEQHGTYPLPEAQLDRFAMKLEIGYPLPEHERAMLEAAVVLDPVHQPRDDEALLAPGDLRRIQEAAAATAVAPAVVDYLVRLATASRDHREIAVGVSPRGLLTWQRAAQAWAYLDGRDFVTPVDVQSVAYPVLSVRLGLERGEATPVIDGLLRDVEVPSRP